MIYLDTSVALAHLLAEDRAPPVSMWNETLISSRLIEYEMWTRVHALSLSRTHGSHVRDLISRIALVELAPPVLTRALEPFPLPVRTVDAIHLATIDFLRKQGQQIQLATYDDRMQRAARKMKVPMHPLRS